MNSIHSVSPLLEDTEDIFVAIDKMTTRQMKAKSISRDTQYGVYATMSFMVYFLHICIYIFTQYIHVYVHVYAT